MAEYIERETVIKALKDNVTEMESYIYFGSNLGVPEDEIEDIVNEIPAADVEPVKHSFWKNNNLYFSNLAECDVCGYEHYNTDEFNYCPNCGAKMDGESND